MVALGMRILPVGGRIMACVNAACLALVLMCAGIGVANAQVVTEFATGITPGAEPFGIKAGPDGNLWFTEFLGNRIGKITPLGVVTEFATGIPPGSNPFGIAAGPDGNLWFTEPNGNRVGRITPLGVVTQFSAGITPRDEPLRHHGRARRQPVVHGIQRAADRTDYSARSRHGVRRQHQRRRYPRRDHGRP